MSESILTSAYEEFLERKTQFGDDSGFAPVFMPDCLFDFQRYLVEFALRGGRNAVLSDCGTGKSLMELVWAENIVRHTNKRVLVMTPNAVSAQTVSEGEKFGIEAVRSKGGVLAEGKKIIVSNYEQLKHFDPNDFVAFVGDECFPWDSPIETPLGLCDIKDIRVGDQIINASGVDIVQRTSRKAVTSAVRITTANQSFTSSPNHPYFTRRGWVNAEDIRPDDALMEADQAMRVVRGGGNTTGISRVEKEILQSILLREMADATAGNCGQSTYFGGGREAGGEEISMVAGRITQSGEGVGQGGLYEPDDQPRVTGQSVGVFEARRAQATSAGRERAGIDGATEDSFELVGVGVGSGVSGAHGDSVSRRSHLLQTGRGERFDEGWNRGGRELAPHDFGCGAGRKERQSTGFHRVDSVEILQQGNPELERYRDESGVIYFYDITATRHPSFSVNGILVHNCSILKNAQGVTRNDVTEFVRHMAYRLMATATPAPNDLFEMGTISEALGHLGHMDMLNRFFKNDLNNSASGRMHGKVIEWRFKGHAEEPFYRYVCSWARAARRPSDMEFDDMVDRDGRSRPFVLPPLEEHEHIIETEKLRDGMLFALPAVGMREQREERRISIEERCDKVADLVDGHDCSLIWCHLNPEGDLLAKTIPDSVQVSGKDSDDEKEEKFTAFIAGQIRRLVLKPKIGAHGLNFQHCAHHVTFPNNSFEQDYQQIRRSWRFGQKRKVIKDVVMTEGDRTVRANQRRKEKQADEMFTGLVYRMNEAQRIERGTKYNTKMELPAWLA